MDWGNWSCFVCFEATPTLYDISFIFYFYPLCFVCFLGMVGDRNIGKEAFLLQLVLAPRFLRNLIDFFSNFMPQIESHGSIGGYDLNGVALVLYFRMWIMPIGQ